jgi:hypothetical protein
VGNQVGAQLAGQRGIGEQPDDQHPQHVLTGDTR